MKYLAIISALAVAMATSAIAQQTKTVTIDTPRFEGERTITRDREAGTYDSNGNLTRKTDGATASHEYHRARTDRGWTSSASQTDFQGRNRSFEYERQRTENGVRARGTATSRNGETYNYKAGRRKTANGYEAGRRVTDADGNVIYKKRVQARRVDGKIQKRTKVVRDPSFKPRKIKPLRPKNPHPRRRHRRGK